MRYFSFLALLALSTATARGGELTVSVTANGAPVRDAVVMVVPVKPVAAKPGQSLKVEQRDIQFQPFVLVVPVGSEIEFPNRDMVRHHVYSFSPAKRFELKLYGKQEERTVRFDKAGAVALGCNIHDRMTAFIRVVDTAFAVKTGADGRARIVGLPDGAATVRVWHPYLKAPGNELSRKVALGVSTAETVQVELRRPVDVF